MAKLLQLSSPQSRYLKTVPQAKAEYSNTQQGLPICGYTLVHLTRHARL
jgi:hypothetical protein